MFHNYPPRPALNPCQYILNHLYVCELWKIPCVLNPPPTPTPCQYVFNRNLTHIYVYLLAELWKIPRHWTWSLVSTWRIAVMMACLSTTAVASSRCTRKWGHRPKAECKCSCKFVCFHTSVKGEQKLTHRLGKKAEKMCTYFHLCMIHLVVLSMFVWKNCFFFGFGFKLLVVQELKGTEVSGDGGKDTGWLEKQKMCTYFNLHDSFGGSVSISLKELLVCVDLSSPWCRS